MFSPDRYGAQGRSFSRYDPFSRGRPFPTLKTSFRNCASGRSSPFGFQGKDRRTPLQKAAHFRLSEPSTPSVLKDRGWRPSDLSDPQKKDFLTHLTSRVFHLNLESGDEEPREKITLERLFTPASDSENLIPLKKKRAFASSCFYRPDHPTIDDQVELAHKISTSLIDENNKSSKGQTIMAARTIVKRIKSLKGKPQLKLVLSPKKVQDFNAVQKHYEELMATSLESTRHITRMEVGKEIATHLESPTGKEAAIYKAEVTLVQKPHSASPSFDISGQ
ncbi:hypothetical protein Anas_00014 [Armadillidium nasatum]|uniref:Uncharacterized protein n=1 Tax=Armadillidium nasatum TaxID=96803 RepID=A0A5N5THJ7_9CRUS|nr:hypothetical protein Anas_00014 [Armadillidium nasatum]